MASTQKLQTTAEGSMWRYYPSMQISDFYVSSQNSAKPAERTQTGTDVKFSVPINLGSSTTLNVPIGNQNFTGNMMLRITGTRGRNHSPMHVMLPGCKANVKSTPTPAATTAPGDTVYEYKTPTGNFLPMNGYDLIENVQIMLPGDEYYEISGEDMFIYLMSQCESEEKRELLWESCRIDPCVEPAQCDSYPSVLLYGAKGKVNDTPTGNGTYVYESFGQLPGRQVLTSAKSKPFECILLMAWPWCSPNKDRRPKPNPTYRFGSQQATINISWKKPEHLNATVSLNTHASTDTELNSLVVSTCDLHFEYFTFANKEQLTSIDQYTYPISFIHPVEMKAGSLKAISGTPGATAQAAVSDVTYTCILNGLKQGETTHLLATFMTSIGECMLPTNIKLDIGGQTILKPVDTQGKLALMFSTPYDDVGTKFYDKRFEFIADANKYQGGNETALTIVSNTTAGSSIAVPAEGQPISAIKAKINLEKKKIPGLPVACWTMIPFGKNVSSTNYHNYALGTRLDTSDVELQFTIPKYYDPTDTDYPYKSPEVTSLRIIQVLNGFYLYNGDKVKRFI